MNQHKKCVKQKKVEALTHLRDYVPVEESLKLRLRRGFSSFRLLPELPRQKCKKQRNINATKTNVPAAVITTAKIIILFLSLSEATCVSARPRDKNDLRGSGVETGEVARSAVGKDDPSLGTGAEAGASAMLWSKFLFGPVGLGNTESRHPVC